MEDIIRRLSRKVEHYDEFLLQVDRECVLADCFKIVNNCDFSPTKLMHKLSFDINRTFVDRLSSKENRVKMVED